MSELPGIAAAADAIVRAAGACALAGLLVSVAVAMSAAEVAGIELPDRAKVGTSELVLNGAGLRKQVLVTVYVASLYLAEKRSSPAGVFRLAGPKRVSVTLKRNLPAADLVEALNRGIRDNCSPAEQQALKSRLEELSATLLSIRQGRKGDVISFDWLPDAGTLVLVNGEPKGKPIPGDDVYHALLRVWVGDRPTNAGLKRALLGQAD